MGPRWTTQRQNRSPVDNTNASLDRVLEEGCSEDEELGEEQLDFSCSEEDYPPPSSPAPVASDLLASPTPVDPVPPARPKGATFTPSSSVQVDKPAVPPPVNGHSTGACSKGKAEARTVKKADPASVASKENGNDKGNVFTRFTPVADSLVDDPPAAAPPVESPPNATSPVDAPELDAPSIPSESCVAPDVQPRPQVTTASSEEWQPVRKRRHSSGNKRQTQTPSPADCNPTPQNNVSSKGKATAFPVDIAANKAPFCSTSVSAWMIGCPLAVSCEFVLLCLAGCFGVHGFCMVPHPCIDEPLLLGYLFCLPRHLSPLAMIG
ncbi:hypothetical protein DKX38_026923 [Salix brachista]|uniref:Uncharacterized protein n=1 Tax=Salix brachista TaxID=2182728 RepID=A0A5N5JG02_9ROSI|nr:hypothetical protein DKX38_026923 [Salix brachista]